ncbi:DUF6452 family protein [Saccharicrinis aurantiacus]|uniref:DUF6452 family protein n=1 Tax=Saccharicrinis aurantiacus TaxID=1849719 RepID=UPI002491DD25|nr:DUF6452 family protein [Saccharicrinis aurantiacus]
MKFNVISIVIVVLVLLGVSCTGSDDICLSGQMSATTGFYSNRSSTETTDKDTTINMRVLGLHPRIDSSHQEVSTNGIFLPLSMESDSTIFELFKDGIGETVVFYHEKELAYVSEECGFIFHFTINSVKYTDTKYIARIEIADKEVSYNKGTENVKIYID